MSLIRQEGLPTDLDQLPVSGAQHNGLHLPAHLQSYSHKTITPSHVRGAHLTLFLRPSRPPRPLLVHSAPEGTPSVGVHAVGPPPRERECVRLRKCRGPAVFGAAVARPASMHRSSAGGSLLLRERGEEAIRRASHRGKPAVICSIAGPLCGPWLSGTRASFPPAFQH